MEGSAMEENGGNDQRKIQTPQDSDGLEKKASSPSTDEEPKHKDAASSPLGRSSSSPASNRKEKKLKKAIRDGDADKQKKKSKKEAKAKETHLLQDPTLLTTSGSLQNVIEVPQTETEEKDEPEQEESDEAKTEEEKEKERYYFLLLLHYLSALVPL
jgi:hypothetical protein